MTSLCSITTIVVRFALALGILTTAEARDNSPFAPIKDDPALPKVLLIGDSISIGYTLPTRALLAGKANVHRPPTNCGNTTLCLRRVDEWVGNGHWDVIHFNFGITVLPVSAADAVRRHRLGIGLPGPRSERSPGPRR